ncbi:TIGR03862 family flavoprotein [Orrella sp. JC864]|uniref:NAD(P)/FAD-dependent oxidoreductase n=1 Tax=Orrella sp. JC864 TaxID=3120298 RepID=UPI00300B41A3
MNSLATPEQVCVAVVGGGPAGLMAAQELAAAGVRVDLYDAMPSVGRKFLLAGRGGLNLTHSEAWPAFLSRYGAMPPALRQALQAFDAQAVRDWAHGLGVQTFVGSSGRVFPQEMKAAPLLRAWLHRLRVQGVRLHMRHRWQGWDAAGRLVFGTGAGELAVQARAVVLALGGGSWPRLGSDGAWLPWLAARGVAVRPLLPANCGFEARWSEHFASRHAGTALKSVALALAPQGPWRPGECMVTAHGLEGGAVYALSACLREAIGAAAPAPLYLDLLPGRDAAWVRAELLRPRGARSWSSHLRTRLNLPAVKVALLRECLGAQRFADPLAAAQALKCLPVPLFAPRPLEEAISSAGGVAFEAMDGHGMLKAVPGVFCAGEMTDWEAPTGGYLLTACLAQGAAAARGVRAWLDG